MIFWKIVGPVLAILMLGMFIIHYCLPPLDDYDKPILPMRKKRKKRK